MSNLNHMSKMHHSSSAEVRTLAPVFKKSDTEFKPQPKLLRSTNTVHIATFNIRTLNRVNQLPKLTAFAAESNIDIVYIQEHRYYHSELEIKYYDTGNGWMFVSVCAWRNSVNAIIGGVRMFLSPHTIKSLNNTEKIQLRMTCASFNSNHSTTVISCYSPTNASAEQQVNFACPTHSQTQHSNHR